MHWDWDALRTALQVLNLAATGAIGLGAWVMRRQMANRAAIERLERTIAELERRLDRHEARIGDMPGHDHLHALARELQRLAEGQKEMEGRMQHISRALDRIETYLLEHDR